MNLLQYLPAFIALAVGLVVIFSELIKKLDTHDRLKGYRVWIPALLSAFFSFLLFEGAFFPGSQLWFWWATIFGISVFFYETILKRFKKAEQET